MFFVNFEQFKEDYEEFRNCLKMVFKTRRNAMAVLEVKELTKKYGEGESEVIALDHVSFFGRKRRICCNHRSIRFREIDTYEYDWRN